MRSTTLVMRNTYNFNSILSYNFTHSQFPGLKTWKSLGKLILFITEGLSDNVIFE